MPTIDLTKGPKTLSIYDVVGKRAEGHSTFIKHVALLDKDQPIEAGDKASVVHMGPPLEQGGRVTLHVAGNVPLTNDEIKEIREWIREIADEYRDKGVSKGRQYVIHPPWKDERDPNTNTPRYRQYSCAGFVLDGHRQVDIELLAIDENLLPEVGPELIESAYDLDPRLLRRYGLEGDGPWRVVLAGYFLHALGRPTRSMTSFLVWFVKEKYFSYQLGSYE